MELFCCTRPYRTTLLAFVLILVMLTSEVQATYPVTSEIAKQVALTDVTGTLVISIQASNQVEGIFTVVFPQPPHEVIMLYTLLPFPISDVTADNGDANIVYRPGTDPNSILGMIFSPTNQSITNIAFSIQPHFISASANTLSLRNQANALYIQDHPGTQTLYFRLNVKPTDNPFGNLSPLISHMLVPNEIRFAFPDTVTFANLVPNFFYSNIQSGTSPGKQSETEATFITSPEFYADDFLWINYHIPSQNELQQGLLAFALVIPLFVLALAGVSDKFIAFGIRMALGAALSILVPVIVALAFASASIDPIIYYQDNRYNVSLAMLYYFATVIVLVIRVLLRLKVFDKLKSIFNRKPP